MEYDQSVIIEFLLNEESDALDITDGLQAQFGEHTYKFRMVEFWITETWLCHQDLHDKIRIGRLSLDDLDAKILTLLNKSPFESAYSIAETLRVVHSTL
jgi:hypothetical protein